MPPPREILKVTRFRGEPHFELEERERSAGV